MLGLAHGWTASRCDWATSLGSWQVKIHDPKNRHAGHDRWVLAGSGWKTLAEACAATELS